MLYYLTIGVLLGVAAGFSPGPLLALVVSESLEHGIGAGVKVALAPLVTDLPIIMITLLIFTQLADIDHILGIISLLGGCYVLYMGVDSFRPKQHLYNRLETKPKSLTKGVLTNALSPHPYMFWLSVGAPIVVTSLSLNIIAPLLFVGGFYFFLVGAKVLLAALVGKSKSFLTDEVYKYIMKFLGIALVVFSAILFLDGLKLLGVFIT